MTVAPSTRFRRSAEEFATRVRRSVGGVNSIVLYGSVARGTAEEGSDIDILVLAPGGEANAPALADISESVDFESSYSTFILATCLKPESLEELSARGFPSARKMLKEGVVLYDDGTFERIRKSAFGVS